MLFTVVHIIIIKRLSDRNQITGLKKITCSNIITLRFQQGNVLGQAYFHTVKDIFGYFTEQVIATSENRLLNQWCVSGTL